MRDPESMHSEPLTTEQIASAGAGEGSADPSQHPVPGVQPGQPAQDWQGPAGSDPGTGDQPHAQLLEDEELRSIRGQWKDIQAEFVDEPRKAVQEADALVVELMQRLAQAFASEREDLESRWAGGEDVSTEDLRHGLRRYRSFFERLLAA
jgi:hypothetical protein